MESNGGVERLPRTEVYRFHSAPEEKAETAMQFRLIYQGPLDPQTSQSRVRQKHEIRRALHPQLKAAWRQFPFLARRLEYFAEQYKRDGFRFVPLINEQQALYCSLDILFLRRDAPGNLVISGGDLDNRIKTLFDAFRITKNKEELGSATPDPDEDPFFVLLEDDSMITEIKITTDRLLTPIVFGAGSLTDVVLIIQVTTPPIDMDDLR